MKNGYIRVSTKDQNTIRQIQPRILSNYIYLCNKVNRTRHETPGLKNYIRARKHQHHN